MKKEQNGRESLIRLKPVVGCNASKRRRRILPNCNLHFNNLKKKKDRERERDFWHTFNKNLYLLTSLCPCTHGLNNLYHMTNNITPNTSSPVRLTGHAAHKRENKN